MLPKRISTRKSLYSKRPDRNTNKLVNQVRQQKLSPPNSPPSIQQTSLQCLLGMARDYTTRWQRIKRQSVSKVFCYLARQAAVNGRTAATNQWGKDPQADAEKGRKEDSKQQPDTVGKNCAGPKYQRWFYVYAWWWWWWGGGDAPSMRAIWTPLQQRKQELPHKS